MYKKISIVLTSLLLIVGCNETKETLGEKLFHDTDLSLTRNTSCATCHNPNHAFVDARFKDTAKDQSIFVNGALSVGDDDVSLGGRNAPTAMYAKFSPTFDVDAVKGGQFHDGRAATLKDQAMGPPLDKAEMMMPNKASVIERIKEKKELLYTFKYLYGENIFDNIDNAYEAMGDAIGMYEKTEEFSPFTSKYDKFVTCKASGKGIFNCLKQGKWSTDEYLGMKLFFSKEKTNCTKCHQLQSQAMVANETFTNYSYRNIGTPKNLTVIARKEVLGLGNKNAVDHGVIKPYPNIDKKFDGAVKIPILRNIAVTGPYMHNGVFQDLRTVLEFYDHMGDGIRRPNNPETGLPWGSPDVNETINRKALRMPVLSDENIEALEAFLRTLTDKRYEHLMPKI